MLSVSILLLSVVVKDDGLSAKSVSRTSDGPLEPACELACRLARVLAWPESPGGPALAFLSPTRREVLSSGLDFTAAAVLQNICWRCKRYCALPFMSWLLTFEVLVSCFFKSSVIIPCGRWSCTDASWEFKWVLSGLDPHTGGSVALVHWQVKGHNNDLHP